MGTELISNYEKMKNEMAGAFLKYDQEAVIRKFDLKYDETYLYLDLLSRAHRISRKTGQVTWSEDGFQTENPADHEWVNTASLSSIQGGTLAKGSDFFQTAGQQFDGRNAALSRACESLGGEKREKGDAAYELKLFPFLPVILRFWDSDEEFPATLQLLVDKNILDYMHYETLMFALSYLLDRLKSEMDASEARF